MNQAYQRFLAVICSSGILLVSAISLAGSSVRYALIVGNNYGNSSTLELDNLKYAEREARHLKNQLIRYGNFDPERVILITGKGRQEILEGAQKLASLHQQDQKLLGPLSTLFAFFFTGHGLSGKLLTNDEPLDADDLTSIFHMINATLTVGFFDACYAGSLDLESLKNKGVISTPGFNPVTELPEELINSEGTLWLVSSRPNELSYEDDRLGGLFTHFFIEAFTQAQPDEIGIPLDNMWEYARRKTLSHASQFGRNQTPEKIVRNLKTRGPLYFSFPQERSARLLFEEGVEGTFLLHYDYGALVEKVIKPLGVLKEVAVYEGKMVISRIDSKTDGDFPSQRISLSKGEEIHIRPEGVGNSYAGLGYKEVPIRSKGLIPELELVNKASQTSLMFGAGYQFHLFRDLVLGVPHTVSVGSLFVHGPWSLGMDFSYGSDISQFESWSFRINEWGIRLHGGYGFGFWKLRLEVEASSSILLYDMKYSSRLTRTPTGGWFGGGLCLMIPLPLDNPWVILQTRISMGALLSEGINASDRNLYWSMAPIFEFNIVVPVLGR